MNNLLIYLFFIAISFPSLINTKVCSYSGTSLDQTHIDHIKSENCNIINSVVAVSSSVQSLEGLSDITIIGDKFSITTNQLLTTLELEKLIIIEGSLIISACDLLSTISFPKLHTIQGELQLTNLPSLTNIDFIQLSEIANNDDLANIGNFPNLKQVEESLMISNTPIVDISGLSNLESIPDSLLLENTKLVTLDDLNINSLSILGVKANSELLTINLKNITRLDELEISQNSKLLHLDGLLPLTEINLKLIIEQNPLLLNLDGLFNVQHIGSDLTILRNDALSNVFGLMNVDIGISFDVVIESNPNLDCSIPCNYDIISSFDMSESLTTDCLDGAVSRCANNFGNETSCLPDVSLCLICSPNNCAVEISLCGDFVVNSPKEECDSFEDQNCSQNCTLISSQITTSKITTSVSDITDSSSKITSEIITNSITTNTYFSSKNNSEFTDSVTNNSYSFSENTVKTTSKIDSDLIIKNPIFLNETLNTINLTSITIILSKKNEKNTLIISKENILIFENTNLIINGKYLNLDEKNKIQDSGLLISIFESEKNITGEFGNILLTDFDCKFEKEYKPKQILTKMDSKSESESGIKKFSILIKNQNCSEPESDSLKLISIILTVLGIIIFVTVFILITILLKHKYQTTHRYANTLLNDLGEDKINRV